MVVLRALAYVVLALYGLCSQASPVAGYSYRKLGEISISNPSFVQLLHLHDSAPPSLWITEFSGNPFVSGKVYTIENVTSYYPDFTKAVPVLKSSSFKWPNKLSTAPKELGDFVVVSDGFLVPGKSTGAVYLLQANCSDSGYSSMQRRLESCKKVELTTSKLGWFYDMAQWKDVNEDGKMDIVTARATKPIIGNTGGELLWLEQPQSDPLGSVPWKEHVLTSGPDVGFTVADLQAGDHQFEVFATEFFSKRLTLFTISTKNASVSSSRDIDTEIGPAYAVSVVDLNSDGSEDLLVTNHVGDSGGSVYAYEIPKDIIKGNFTKHVLATDFPVTASGSNQAAPGFAYAFKPLASYTGKPYILVAGDGAQTAYLLQPMDKDFTYNKTVVLAPGGVIGSIGVDNLIGSEGWAEFFVPDYTNGKLYAFAFGP